MPHAARTLTTPSPSPASATNPETPSVLSYFALRRAAGYIGIVLPLAVVLIDCLSLGCLPDSISASYYTPARNLFVGSLCAVGIFLICSIGYKDDEKYSIFAGIMACLVAFFPTSYPECSTQNTGGSKVVCALEPRPALSRFNEISPYIHGTAAVLLFLTFAYFCLVLFRRKADNPTKRKLLRNNIYLGCGVFMLLAMAAYPASKIPGMPHVSHTLLYVEWVCLWLFGLAWLVKGEQLFADTNPNPQNQAH